MTEGWSAIGASTTIEKETLQPVYRVLREEHREEYRTFSKSGDPIAFRAVVARRWPSGLVPVFSVRRKGRVTLQRFAPRGQEALTEPLFFALPGVGETTNRELLGRWECVATHDADGAKEFFAWDLCLLGTELRGRFDIDTDFRFASIEAGRIVGDKIEFGVRYIEAQYRLEGNWRTGTMEGTWRKLDDATTGSWQAERPSPCPRLPEGEACELWAFEHGEHGVVFRLEGEALGPGWVRRKEPICRVWR